jgi:hypothetical protein
MVQAAWTHPAFRPWRAATTDTFTQSQVQNAMKDDQPKRPVQYSTADPAASTHAGPHRGHIRATNDQTAADNTGHQRSSILTAQQLTSASIPVVTSPRFSLARRTPGVQIPLPPPHIAAGQAHGVIRFRRLVAVDQLGGRRFLSAVSLPDLPAGRVAAAGRRLASRRSRPGRRNDGGAPFVHRLVITVC